MSKRRKFSRDDLEWHHRSSRFRICHWWHPKAPNYSRAELTQAVCWEVLRRHPHWARLDDARFTDASFDWLRPLSFGTSGSAALAILCLLGPFPWPNIPKDPKAIFIDGLSQLMSSDLIQSACTLKAPRPAILNIEDQVYDRLPAGMTTTLYNSDPKWDKIRDEIVGKSFQNVEDLFDQIEDLAKKVKDELQNDGWRVLTIAINPNARSNQEVINAFKEMLSESGFRSTQKLQKMRVVDKLGYIRAFEQDSPGGEERKYYSRLFEGINLEPFIRSVLRHLGGI